jgi:hypothetical protein
MTSGNNSCSIREFPEKRGDGNGYPTFEGNFRAVDHTIKNSKGGRYIAAYPTFLLCTKL